MRVKILERLVTRPRCEAAGRTFIAEIPIEIHLEPVLFRSQSDLCKALHVTIVGGHRPVGLVPN